MKLSERLRQFAQNMGISTEQGDFQEFLEMAETLEANECCHYEDWKTAINRLKIIKKQYESIGGIGSFGIAILDMYQTRYESGERTRDLYDSMMGAE